MKRKMSKSGIIACVVAGAALAAGAAALSVYLKGRCDSSRIESGNDEPVKLPAPETKMSFSSFDGGGPEYSISIEDEAVLEYDMQREYNDPEHEQKDGSSYDVIFTFRGLKPGKTMMTISARSPIADNFDDVYSVTVSDSLEISIEKLSSFDRNESGPVSPTAVLVMETEEEIYYANLDDNDAVMEFSDKLSSEPAELSFSVGEDGRLTAELPWQISSDPGEADFHAGDIILTDSDRIELVRGDIKANAVRLAEISEITPEEIDRITADEAPIVFSLEWSE